MPLVRFAQRVIQTTLALDPLANLPRTGWRLRGVVPCESIAEHSYGVAVVAMLLVDELRARGEAIDGELVLRMALLHDAGEVRTGDIPLPGKSPALKRELEHAEASFVEATLPPPQQEAWRAVEQGDSLEARVVKALNTVNCAIMVAPETLAEPGDIFVSGNDAGAKADVVALLNTFGWPAPVDLGDITTARGTEQYLALWVRLMKPMGGANFNIKLVK